MPVGLLDPAFKGDPEDGDACLGSQARRWFADAAPAQRVRERCGEGCELAQLALLKLGVGSNDALALTGEFAPLLQESAGGLEGRADRFDGGDEVRRAGEPADEKLLQCARAREQNLALVREVPEERSLREPRALGDLYHRGLFKPALTVKLQGRLLEPAAGVWLPSTHPRIVAMTATVMGCYADDSN